MSMNTTINVKHIQRGQPRAYAPHTYRSEIEIVGFIEPTKSILKDIVRAFVHPFTEKKAKPGDMGSYFQPRLTQLEFVRGGYLRKRPNQPKWEVPYRRIYIAQVEEPYCD